MIRELKYFEVFDEISTIFLLNVSIFSFLISDWAAQVIVVVELLIKDQLHRIIRCCGTRDKVIWYDVDGFRIWSYQSLSLEDIGTWYRYSLLINFWSQIGKKTSGFHLLYILQKVPVGPDRFRICTDVINNISRSIPKNHQFWAIVISFCRDMDAIRSWPFRPFSFGHFNKSDYNGPIGHRILMQSINAKIE